MKKLLLIDEREVVLPVNIAPPLVDELVTFVEPGVFGLQPVTVRLTGVFKHTVSEALGLAGVSVLEPLTTPEPVEA